MNYNTLITASDLYNILNDQNIAVFDCRHDLLNKNYGLDQFNSGHITGSVFASVDHNLSDSPNGSNGRHPLPKSNIFTSWLGEMGVTTDSTIVCYDDAGGTYASRLWWMLRHWMGQKRVAVLDGGWNAWLKLSFPIEKKTKYKMKKIYKSKSIDDLPVKADELLANLTKQSVTVIDARSNDRFLGQNETIDPIGGHIPGAINRFYKDNLDEEGHFKHSEQLRTEFLSLLDGLTPNTVVHQCGSGITACHNLLAMEIAGLKQSRLYPGSWSEWIVDSSRPTVPKRP